MINYLKKTIFLITLLFALPINAQEFPKGKWEVMTQTVIPHVMTPMPAHKDVICVNDKNKERPPIAAHESCEFSNYKIVGNGASWQMKCKGELNMNGAGRIIFSANQYKGSAIVKMKIPQSEPMEIDHTYTGKRIGDCK
ncbi:DUF3617 domain-containing protein [Nitrosomonas sp.]|uniref:DUF3617 domain-containing protein n=1 Tax=Nitrosomonas sp. TaxID=42353 RepID=UPI0025F9D3CD|nr:DUF3617 family protein [Nitrosomonas sp.]